MESGAFGASEIVKRKRGRPRKSNLKPGDAGPLKKPKPKASKKSKLAAAFPKMAKVSVAVSKKAKVTVDAGSKKAKAAAATSKQSMAKPKRGRGRPKKTSGPTNRKRSATKSRVAGKRSGAKSRAGTYAAAGSGPSSYGYGSSRQFQLQKSRFNLPRFPEINSDQFQQVVAFLKDATIEEKSEFMMTYSPEMTISDRLMYFKLKELIRGNAELEEKIAFLTKTQNRLSDLNERLGNLNFK